VCLIDIEGEKGESMNFKLQGYRSACACSHADRKAKFWETFLLICCGLLAFSRCKTLELASTWAMKPVIADGELTDWIIATGNTLNTEDGAQVNVSNDSTNLYLMIRFRANNKKWTRACALSGLTVWLDPTGKKSTNFGIRFGAGPSLESLEQSAEIGTRPGGMESGPKMPRHRLDGQLTVINKKASPDTIVSLPSDGSHGPSAVFTFQSGICTYELTLPLYSVNTGAFAMGVKPGKIVMVGLTAGLSKEEREAMSDERHETPRGGMGGAFGPPGGSMGGGRPGGGPPGGGMGGGQRPTMPESPELWFKVKLAPAPELGGNK